MTPRSRQYHPPGSGGGGNGSALAAILGALVGVPGLEGGESLAELAGPEDTQGVIPPNARTPYTVAKPTLGQKILNPRGVAASDDMANMLKFEDYQNQLRSGLVDQHNQGQINLENLRHQGDLAEKAAAEQSALKKWAWEHSQTLEDYERNINDPEVKAAVRKGLIDTGLKQGFENQKTDSQTREIEAGIPAKRFLTLRDNETAYDPSNGFSLTSRGPINFDPPPGYEGGLKTRMLPANPATRSSSPGRFVPQDGGVAAELGAFKPMDVSEIGNLNEPYIPPGINPTVNGSVPAPKSQPVTTSVANPLMDMGRKILGGAMKPFQDTANYIKKIPTPAVNTGQFQQDFVDPVKSFMDNLIGQSPRPVPNPNAYEDYLKGQQAPQGYTNPSMQPMVEPPNILEQMKRRRQLMFPQPVQPYYPR